MLDTPITRRIYAANGDSDLIVIISMHFFHLQTLCTECLVDSDQFQMTFVCIQGQLGPK